MGGRPAWSVRPSCFEDVSFPPFWFQGPEPVSLGGQPLINPGEPAGKRFDSVDHGVLDLTIHATHVTVGFTVNGDTIGMDALPLGFPQRGFGVFQRILIFILAVQWPAVT